MWRHVFLLCFISGFAAPTAAFPNQMRMPRVSLIEETKARVVMRQTKPVVLRKSSVSLSLTIIRKEQQGKRKKFVIPDIPKPK